MIHLRKNSQLPICTFGIFVIFEGPIELLDGYLPFEVAVIRRAEISEAARQFI